MPIANRIVAERSWDYRDRLKSLGIKRLGRGSNAEVFQHPKYKDIVVKVYQKTDRDKGEYWLKWCMKHQSNPYVPRLYKIGKLKNLEIDEEDEGYVLSHHIAFMEKLQKATKSEIDKMFKTGGALGSVVRFHKWGWDFADEFMEEPDWSPITDPHLLEVLKVIYSKSIGEDDWESVDMIVSNFMKRPNGRVVFTDPLC